MGGPFLRRFMIGEESPPKTYAKVNEFERNKQIQNADPLLIGALFQLMDELEKEANSGAAASVANHGICASSVGGAEHIRLLKERIQGIIAAKDVKKQVEQPRM